MDSSSNAGGRSENAPTMNMEMKSQRSPSMEMLSTTRLPSDVIEEILAWVPTKPLLRFASLNKQFHSLISCNPKFAKKHLIQTRQNKENHSFILQMALSNVFYYIPDGSFEKAVKLDTSYMYKLGDYSHIEGSSNGLICLSHGFVSELGRCRHFYTQQPKPQGPFFTISLWNPRTNEYKELPHPHIQAELGYWRARAYVILGFGFHPTINDYKIVRLVQDIGRPLQVEVYSLSTNTWRRVEGDFPYLVLDELSRAVLNGVAHWKACRAISNHKSEDLILSFDMADEVFHTLPMPKGLDVPQMYLRLFQEEFLSMFVVGENNKFIPGNIKSTLDIDLWVMKEYGVRESWTKLLRMQNGPLIQFPMDFLKNGDLLLHNQQKSNELASYSPETEMYKYLDVHELEERSNMCAVPYVETLIQLSTQYQATEAQQTNSMEICEAKSGNSTMTTNGNSV